MPSRNEPYILAENFSSSSSESLKVSGFPVTKSVGDLKAAIAEHVGSGCGPEDITVTFGSQELDDPTKSLADYHIHNGDTVDYLHFTVAELDDALKSVLDTSGATQATEGTFRQIYFKDIKGVNFAVRDVPVDSTVKGLREMLARDRGNEYLDDLSIRLLWKKTQLEKDQELRKLGTKQEVEVRLANSIFPADGSVRWILVRQP